MGTAVPVCQEQNPLARLRVEPGDEVGERQRITASRHVGPGLRDHGVRALPQQAVEPRGLAAVRLGAGDPRTESDLGLDVFEGGRAVECRSPWRGLPAAEHEQEGKKNQQ